MESRIDNIIRPTTIGITDASQGIYITKDLDTMNNKDIIT